MVIEHYGSTDGDNWALLEREEVPDDTTKAGLEGMAKAIVGAVYTYGEVRRDDGFILASWGPEGKIVKQEWEVLNPPAAPTAGG